MKLSRRPSRRSPVAGWQVFRVRLVDAAKNISDVVLMNFNSVSPDFVFKIGDTKTRMLELGRSVGLDAAQLAKFEAKIAELPST